MRFFIAVHAGERMESVVRVGSPARHHSDRFFPAPWHDFTLAQFRFRFEPIRLSRSSRLFRSHREPARRLTKSDARQMYARVHARVLRARTEKKIKHAALCLLFAVRRFLCNSCIVYRRFERLLVSGPLEIIELNSNSDNYCDLCSDRGVTGARAAAVHLPGRRDILLHPRHQYSSRRRDGLVLGGTPGHFLLATVEELSVNLILVTSINIWHVDLNNRYNEDL